MCENLLPAECGEEEKRCINLKLIEAMKNRFSKRVAAAAALTFLEKSFYFWPSPLVTLKLSKRPKTLRFLPSGRNGRFDIRIWTANVEFPDCYESSGFVPGSEIRVVQLYLAVLEYPLTRFLPSTNR